MWITANLSARIQSPVSSYKQSDWEEETVINEEAGEREGGRDRGEDREREIMRRGGGGERKRSGYTWNMSLKVRMGDSSNSRWSLNWMFFLLCHCGRMDSDTCPTYKTSERCFSSAAVLPLEEQTLSLCDTATCWWKMWLFLCLFSSAESGSNAI